MTGNVVISDYYNIYCLILKLIFNFAKEIKGEEEEEEKTNCDIIFSHFTSRYNMCVSHHNNSNIRSERLECFVIEIFIYCFLHFCMQIQMIYCKNQFSITIIN